MISGAAFDSLSLVTLRLIVAIAEEGGLSRAALRENIAISAVSKRLSDLEASLGSQLFERTARGMLPTPSGNATILHARRILLAANALSLELSEFRTGARGSVRVFANLSSIVSFLPEDLERFFLRYPDLKIDLEERPTSRVMKGVVDELADLGICSADTDRFDLVRHLYRQDQLVLMMPPDHVLAGKGPVKFADTLAFDHVSLHAESSIFMRSMMAARDASQVLKRRIHVPGFDAVCRTVQVGLGIAIIPEPVFDILGRPMGLHYEELDEIWAKRDLVIVHRREAHLSVPARLLMDHLCKPA